MEMTPLPRACAIDAPAKRRIALVGKLILAAVPMFMLGFLLLRPSTNSDMFWQLKLGELTLANGAPLTVEPFAVTHLGEPLQNLAWAGQALMALVLEWTGWRGLRLFDALCWVGGFWAVAAACVLRGRQALPISIGLGLAFIAALPTAILRPQSMASICFGLLLVLLGSKLETKSKIVAGTVLLLVWQNLHPSVSIAFGVLGIHAAVGLWQWWQDRSSSIPVAEISLVPISVGAMFCTPDGISILQTSAYNGEISLLVGVGEWMPLWAPLNHGVALPIVAVAVLAVFVMRKMPGQVDLREALTCLALFAMTVLVYRFVLFWAISLVAVVASCRTRSQPQGDTSRSLITAGIGVFVVAAAITALKPVEFRSHIPIEALHALKRENLTGTVFSDFTMGGAVIHVGYPQWQVAYDGRFYRYSREEWHRFAKIQSGDVGLSEIEKRYHPVAWVLHPRRNARLAAEMDSATGRWRRIWRDDHALIYVPAIR